MNEYDLIRGKIKHCKEVVEQHKDETPKPVLEVVDTLVDISTLLVNKLESLENKVNKNSRNSSKPPSSDDSPTRKSKKKKGKKVGAQKGHKGNHLKRKKSTDEVILDRPQGKCGCGVNLSELNFEKEIRQVQDIKILLKIIDYIGFKAKCSCGKLHCSNFPGNVTSATQYGSLARALAVYFKNYQLIPFERSEEIFRDIFGLSLSQGTVFNSEKKADEQLEEFENYAKQAALNTKVGHADESPIKVESKMNYLHVFSSKYLTLLFHHKHRGLKAVDDIGLLKNYQGILVHDCYRMYHGLGKHHALCNAHLIRELTWSEEVAKIRWGHELRRFLEDTNELIKLWKQEFEYAPADEVTELKKEFNDIMTRGELEILPLKNKGRKQDPNYNLYMRIKKYQNDVLRFIEDWDVPFTNNQAERDLRMVKIQQKITGGFRTKEGAKKYARIRSYLSTIKKQKKNILEGLEALFTPKSTYIQELLAVST